MTFVFLHGLAGDPDDIFHASAHLPSHRFIAPRIPYFEDEMASVTDLADVLIPEIRRSNPGKTPILVGNSLGGMVALALADTFPQAHLTLVGTHMVTTSRPVHRTGGGFDRELGFIFHNRSALTETRKARYRKKWMDFTSSRKGIRRLRTIKALASAFDIASRFERFQHRITLVCGRNDQISSLHQFTELHRHHRGLRIHIIEECGHAIPLEHPACLARILAGQIHTDSTSNEF
ncbi:alpha/beta fold hydrolase [Desulfovibrio inopinatus]|uniref:alpha/beta fold hydrolase n=1 Tax=Desulfovibrio inopinatus TaxID=102109 RepID=UPI0004827521|nr:alpha/beta hydrolase [Desulfovibrio inopinatus]